MHINFTTIAAPVLAIAITMPTLDAGVLMACAAGGLVSMLVSIRRTIKNDEPRPLGQINAVIAIVAGVSMGIIFANQLSGASLFGFTNPLAPSGTGFTVALCASMILDMMSDGTFSGIIKRRLLRDDK